MAAPKPLELGPTGPAQSDYLYHFTGRAGRHPDWVPQKIRDMSPQGRLAAILRSEKLWAFPPHGSPTPCVCFSESTDEHLGFLVREKNFRPWGVVVTRPAVLRNGGGAVAYLPTEVWKEFPEDLKHWAVRTDDGSTWLHEREWRLPRPEGGTRLMSVNAVLIGNPAWRPPRIMSWVDASTGDVLPKPDGNPHAEPVSELPRLWRESAIWVWDRKHGLVKHAPGTLS